MKLYYIFYVPFVTKYAYKGGWVRTQIGNGYSKEDRGPVGE